MNKDMATQSDKVPTSQDANDFISMLERLAKDPAVDPVKLHSILDVRERILAKSSEQAFNSAFSEMQGEIPVITKYGEIKVSGQIRSTYAKFEDINEAIKPILQKYGFSVTFKVDTKDSKITVTGILMHKAGHREQTEITLDSDTSGSKNTVQATGSSVAYGKRYTLSALVNISTTDEDDDGESGGKQIASCWKGPRERARYSTELQRAWGKRDIPGYVQLWDELELDQKKDVWSDFNSTQRNEMKEMIASARKGEPEVAGEPE